MTTTSSVSCYLSLFDSPCLFLIFILLTCILTTGMTGKQIEYTSVPYKSILAYSVETSGSIDTDQELKLYAHGIGKLSIDLVKSIDVMPIYRFLNLVVIQGEKMAGKNADDGAVIFDNSAQKADPSSTGFLDIVLRNVLLGLPGPNDRPYRSDHPRYRRIRRGQDRIDQNRHESFGHRRTFTTRLARIRQSGTFFFFFFERYCD